MLTQIRSFLVVLEENSLNRAAARLRLSQPALSRQMQALETEVGGRLLERTSTGVQPTDAGHALAARMRPILAEYDTAMAAARRLVRGDRQLLRIGYLASAAKEFLNPALAVLRRSHPEAKVKLLDATPGEQIAALRAGEIDVGLIGQEGKVLAQDFYTRKLATLPIVAIVPADHRLASRRRIHLADLKGEEFIGAPDKEVPGRNRWITQLCRKAGFRARFAGEGDSLSSTFTMIANEGAITVGPAYLKDYPSTGIVMIPIADTWATWDLLVVWQRGRTAGALAALLEALPSGECPSANRTRGRAVARKASV